MMEEKYLLSEEKLTEIATGLNISLKQVTATLDLLADGCTVPFIARYRKEVTGALNDEQIKAISDNYEYVKSLEKRKMDVIRLIDEKGLLNPELEAQILAATKLVEIEAEVDIKCCGKASKFNTVKNIVCIDETGTRLDFEIEYNKDYRILQGWIH